MSKVPVAARAASPFASKPASYQQRFATWEADRAAQLRATQHKMISLLTLVLIVAAVIVYALTGW